MLAALIRRLSRDGQRPPAPSRRFVPTLDALGGRALPSASPAAALHQSAHAAHAADPVAGAPSVATPFKITGGGIAADGLPLTPFTPAPHDATGTATRLGKYTAEGTFQLTGFTGPLTATFESAGPVVFTAANGDQLVFRYGDTTAGAAEPGSVTLYPLADGRVYAVFVAEFAPDPELSTGRFKNVSGGSFVMVATTEPFVLGSTEPTAYTWEGEGSLAFNKGNGKV